MGVKYKISLITIVFFLILFVVIGKDYVTYTKKYKTSGENAVVINDGNLSINYDAGAAFLLSKESKVVEKKFSVTNMADSTNYYVIRIEDVNTSTSLLENLSFSLDSEDGTSIDGIILNDTNETITEVVKIAPNATHSYKLTIAFTGELEKSIEGKIHVNVSEYNGQTFSDIILTNNQINSFVTTPGTSVATTNEGLIESTDEDGKTYYFRGKVDNNFVSFAGYTWRIVRINGNGTVRLILNTLMNDDVYTYNTHTLPENREDYYTLANYEETTLASVLEDWYTNTLIPYSKSISETKFCNETSIGKEEGSTSYFLSYVSLIEEENPSFTCSGNIYQNEIGLLSAEEAIFAGAYKNNGNTEFYLHNPSISKDWWLSTPYQVTSEHSVHMFSFSASQGLFEFDNPLTDQRGLRPVISIRDDVLVTGTGTEEDPYIIQ